MRRSEESTPPAIETAYVRRDVCTRCGQSQPLNELFRLGGQTLCQRCADDELQRRAGENVPADDLARLSDPTVCALCQGDYGSQELPRVAGLALCPACDERCRARPFPDWLKRGLVALLVLAGLSIFYHRRFVAGYVHAARASRAQGRGDLAGVIAHFEKAAALVPEDPSMQAMAAFYRGLLRLQEDRSAEALKELEAARKVLGSEAGFDRFILSAEAGAAFDEKNYARFLDRQQALARLYPDDAIAVAGVASAYACQFAVSGDDALKRQALEQLERARRLSVADPGGFKEYEDRILYRVSTREIISRQEYDKRFHPAAAAEGKR